MANPPTTEAQQPPIPPHNPSHNRLHLTATLVGTQPWLRSVFGVEGPVELWWGIEPISAGVFGVPVGFAVMVAVSLVTRRPPLRVQALVEQVRSGL